MSGESSSQYPPLGREGPITNPRLPYFTPGHDPFIPDDVPEITYETPKASRSYLQAPLTDEASSSDDVSDDSAFERSMLDAINDHDRDTNFAPADSGDEQPSDDTSSVSSEYVSTAGKGRRGAARGRGRPPGRGRGRGRARGWRVALAAMHPQEPPPRGRGSRRRGRPRGEGARGGGRGKRGPQAAVEPSFEFKQCQAKATTAFLNGNLPEAIEHAQQAIQINPEIFAAHSLLSQLYADMGMHKESLDTLWAGAYTKRDPEIWWDIASRILQMNPERDETVLEQVLSCYSQIIKCDVNDFDARKGRLEIYAQLDHTGKAIRECQFMLKTRPFDLNTLQVLAEQCIKGSQADIALRAYDKAIDHHMSMQPDGDREGFSFDDLNIYVELYIHLAQWKPGLQRLRQVSRWLCGRKDEQYWDSYDGDDREWDEEDEPRRLAVPEFISGKYPQQAYGDGLRPELRAKLGILRLRMGGDANFQESLKHFELFSPDIHSPEAFVNDFPDLFTDIAEALFTEARWSQALRFYEAFEAAGFFPDHRALCNMAKCYEATDNELKMQQFYERIIEREPNTVDERIKLARLYEKRGDAAKALVQVQALMRRGKSQAVMQANLIPPKRPEPPREMLMARSSTMRALAPRRLPELLPKPSPQTPFDPSLVPPADGASPPEQTAPGVDDLSADEATPIRRRRRNRAADKPQKRPYKKRTQQESPSKTRPPAQPVRGTAVSRIPELYSRLLELSEEKTSEWTVVAQDLVDGFLAERVFFNNDRQTLFLGYTAEARARAKFPKMNGPLADLAHQLRNNLDITDEDGTVLVEADSVPQDYCGIPFSSWLDIFCQLALHLARDGDREGAYKVLTDANSASVFMHDPYSVMLIHTTELACALTLQDEPALCNLVRWYQREIPYATDNFRLFALVNRLYGGTVNWYNAGPTQKWFMRVIKGNDFALLTEPQRKAFGYSEAEYNTYSRQPDAGVFNKVHPASGPRNPHGLESVDPQLLVLYGHLLATHGSFQNCLNYYYRALTAQPNNPMTLLSIAVAYVQVAMKRQNENRHHNVLMGVGFMTEYRRVRLNMAKTDRVRRQRLTEVEYNEGRLWHLLGLAHLAIPAYRRCLAVEEKQTTDTENATIHEVDDAENEVQYGEEPDFKMEAAYNLQMLLATGGDMEGARAIGEQWLVF